MKRKRIGERLKEARLSQGISLEVAARALGEAIEEVEEIEEGGREPTSLEVMVLDALYGSSVGRRGAVALLFSAWGPFFSSLLLWIPVNPFIPIYPFEGRAMSLAQALDARTFPQGAPGEALGLLAACATSFAVSAFLFFSFLLPKGRWIWSATFFGIEAIVFFATLSPFPAGPWIGALALLAGILSSWWAKKRC